MKSNLSLPIGGDLFPGDVVAVAYNNCNVFGWFVESGKYGSLKFISFPAPERAKSYYEDFARNPNPSDYQKRRYHKGFVFNNVAKDYIVTWSNNRAFKIPNPEEFFKDSIIETMHAKGKEILNQLNFPAK